MSLVAIWVAAVAVAFAFALPSLADDHTEFIVRIGVMEPAMEGRDRLRPTRSLTMDPSRRPGFCFIVDAPTDDPYEVYSVHTLPAPPGNLTGDFAGESTDRAPSGLTTRTKRTDGIRPFCFDFHDGDPIGTYQIRVFINSALTASFDLQVTELDDHPEPDAVHRWNDPQRRADESQVATERE